MTMTIFNTAKSRLETVDFEISDHNTTWFEECEKDHEVYTITDMNGGKLVGSWATVTRFGSVIYQERILATTSRGQQN